MRLEFETGEMTANDAASVVGMLIILFPDLPTKLELFGSTGLTITGTLEGAADLADRVFAPPPSASAEEVFAPPSADGAAAADGSSATPPLVAAAAPPPAAPKAPPSGVEVDSTGIPWDGRIHAATKGKTKGGEWRGKKGAPADLIAAVTAELKATMGVPLAASAAPPATPQPPTVASAPLASDASPAPAATSPPTQSPVPNATDGGASSSPPAGAPAAAAPPPPSDPATSAQPAAPPPSDAAPIAPIADGADVPPAVLFGNLMRDVTALQTAGRLSAESVANCVAAVQLPTLAGLINRPDLIPAFRATMDALTTPLAA